MKTKETYNLTRMQRLLLPIIWLYWFSSPAENKKSWHELKKGMEKHICDFKQPYKIQGYRFLKCTHTGCNTCWPVETSEEVEMYNKNLNA